MSQGGGQKGGIMGDTILLIDGMYLVFSSFYSHRNMRTLAGEPTGAVFGFVTRVENLIKELQPGRIAVAFDTREKTFRHKKYPPYKAKREEPPEELIQQLPHIKQYLNSRGIDMLEQPGFEADDIIAKIAWQQGELGNEVVIFTSDKDLFQLVGRNITIYHPKLKQKLDGAGIEEFFGVKPVQIVDFLTLTGDSSDNIPGIPGIGEKTALKILHQFGSVDDLLKRLNEADPKIKKKVEENLSSLKLSRELVDLGFLKEKDMTFELSPFKDEFSSGLIDLYKALSFNTLLKKIPLPEVPEAGESGAHYATIRTLDQLETLVRRIKKERYFAFDLETTGVAFFKSEIVGLSIAFMEGGYYIPFLYPDTESSNIEITFSEFKKHFSGIFANGKIKKSGHNLKFDILHLKQAGIEVQGLADDSMVISYLLFPNRRSHRLKDLSKEFLDYQQTEYEDLAGRGKDQVTLDKVSVDRVGRYCIDDSFLSLKLVELLRKNIAERDQDELYRNVEMPLVEVLAAMEFGGVEIDGPYLEKAAKDLETRISQIAQEIYRMAGFTFNINSSQQLGELLFEKMNLPVKKRTRKTRSYSTDFEVLSELQSYPIVQEVISYRTFKKLHSTYLIGLLDHKDDDNRVHTSYNQAVTATGRLSSSNPNLQNIPVGETGGVNVRKAFVAGKGHRLLSADYSQIELRVMAHYSGDEKLVEAFARDFDIHQHTADLVFSQMPLLGEPEKRRRAKIINFSILYGSGAYSLAKELGVGYAEAKRFIDRYFETYLGVKEFIDKTIEETEKSAEVHTILGRRRAIPEIQSSNRTVKENGNRMAINTIIQGSAADIIKIAMIRIQSKLDSLGSRLVLQVHDELVFEYPLEEESVLLQLVRNEMEKALPLKVPLKVTVKKGQNWGELSPLDK